MIADKEVELLLTGYCGPNAFRTVQAGGIKVVNDVAGTVEQAIQSLLSGKVKYSDSANVEGHW